MTAPSAKTSFIDGILANDFNWPRTNVYVGQSSFDSSPVTGQFAARTDRFIDYVWSGTNWISRQTFQTILTSSDAPQPLAQGTHYWQGGLTYGDSGNGVYIARIDRQFYFNVAQSASNYYTWSLAYYTNANASAGTFTPATTQTLTGTAFRSIIDTPGQILGPTVTGMQMTCSAVGTPGSFYATITISYKLIGA